MEKNPRTLCVAGGKKTEKTDHKEQGGDTLGEGEGVF